MRYGTFVALLAIFSLSRADVVPEKEWKHVANVEKAGWSREKLSLARQYADLIHSSAVMIVQGGEVVDEWGDAGTKISSYSVRKSLISAL